MRGLEAERRAAHGSRGTVLPRPWEDRRRSVAQRPIGCQRGLERLFDVAGAVCLAVWTVPIGQRGAAGMTALCPWTKENPAGPLYDRRGIGFGADIVAAAEPGSLALVAMEGSGLRGGRRHGPVGRDYWGTGFGCCGRPFKRGGLPLDLSEFRLPNAPPPVAFVRRVLLLAPEPLG